MRENVAFNSILREPNLWLNGKSTIERCSGKTPRESMRHSSPFRQLNPCIPGMHYLAKTLTQQRLLA